MSKTKLNREYDFSPTSKSSSTKSTTKRSSLGYSEISIPKKKDGIKKDYNFKTDKYKPKRVSIKVYKPK